MAGSKIGRGTGWIDVRVQEKNSGMPLISPGIPF